MEKLRYYQVWHLTILFVILMYVLGRCFSSAEGKLDQNTHNNKKKKNKNSKT